MIKILILENNSSLRSLAQKAMRDLGYESLTVHNTEEALEMLGSGGFQLVLGDQEDGALELCRQLREAGSTLPFLVLLEDNTPRKRRQTFRAGADGYLELPPDPEELQMRVKHLLWRCRMEDSAVLSCGDCLLRTSTMTLETPGQILGLRRMEFLLLEKLLSYPGRIFTRAQLLDELWGYDCESGPRTVDTHIRRLRQKLKGTESIRIQTIRGIGYRAAVSRAKE